MHSLFFHNYHLTKLPENNRANIVIIDKLLWLYMYRLWVTVGVVTVCRMCGVHIRFIHQSVQWVFHSQWVWLVVGWEEVCQVVETEEGLGHIATKLEVWTQLRNRDLCKWHWNCSQLLLELYNIMATNSIHHVILTLIHNWPMVILLWQYVETEYIFNLPPRTYCTELQSSQHPCSSSS